MDCEYKIGGGVRPLLCGVYAAQGKREICQFQKYCSCNGHYSIVKEAENCALRECGPKKDNDSKIEEHKEEHKNEINTPKNTEDVVVEQPVKKTKTKKNISNNTINAEEQ